MAVAMMHAGRTNMARMKGIGIGVLCGLRFVVEPQTKAWGQARLNNPRLKPAVRLAREPQAYAWGQAD